MVTGLYLPAGMCPIVVLSTWECSTMDNGEKNDPALLSALATNTCHLQLDSESAILLFVLGQPL